MQVIKRSGKREDVSFDKITARVKKLCYGLNQQYVDPIEISKRVIQGLYDGVSTTELDNLQFAMDLVLHNVEDGVPPSSAKSNAILKSKRSC